MLLIALCERNWISFGCVDENKQVSRKSKFGMKVSYYQYPIDIVVIIVNARAGTDAQ